MLTAVEKENVDKAKHLVGALFPAVKLVARLNALGAVDLAAPKYKSFPDRLPSALRADLWFRIPRTRESGGDVYVSIWFFALQRSGTWETTEYSMHFGPTPRDADPPVGPNFYFRVCDNPNQGRGHHFHHHRYPNAFVRGHIPASAANPALPSTVDPAWFVGILEVFLKTNQVPIEVIQ